MHFEATDRRRKIWESRETRCTKRKCAFKSYFILRSLFSSNNESLNLQYKYVETFIVCVVLKYSLKVLHRYLTDKVNSKSSTYPNAFLFQRFIFDYDKLIHKNSNKRWKHYRISMIKTSSARCVSFQWVWCHKGVTRYTLSKNFALLAKFGNIWLSTFLFYLVTQQSPFLLLFFTEVTREKEKSSSKFCNFEY